MKKAIVLLIAGFSVLALAARPGPPRASLGPLTEKKAAHGKPGVAQLGVHRKIQPKLLQKGKWQKSGWTLVLQSPGAQGLRVHVTGMDLGTGNLTFRSADGEVQTFTGKGPNGDGDFWTGLVSGDCVRLELEGARKGSLPFRVPELSHLWRLP